LFSDCGFEHGIRAEFLNPDYAYGVLYLSFLVINFHPFQIFT
jgi:hypothetical protein